MNEAEYSELARVEETHWYYAGKRELVAKLISTIRPPQPTDTLLDCGAGTGRFAEEMSAHCRVLVLDGHEQALKMLRTRFKPEQIFALTGDNVPLPDQSLEMVSALDVLEHTPDDKIVVKEFLRLLKPGGIAIVTVPASMALWSAWDESLHHYRRYTRPQLVALFPPERWEVAYVNYTNVPVFPIVWLIRKMKRWQPNRLDDRPLPSWLNWLLRRQFVGLALSRVPMPFGVSLVLLARKRG
jgi:ubiquinone/menaquinone biosynthesis C-methylase UbiE